MPSYWGSYVTSWDAMPTKPYSWESLGSRSMSPRMALMGRKVARPASRRFKKEMASLASVSRSTTMFCRAAPRAISRATVYWGWVLIRLATGPRIPDRVLRSAACMTAFTAREKPSYSFSISVSRRMRSSLALAWRRS